jgi:hypothetical protein
MNFADRPIIEQGHALEVVMSALNIGRSASNPTDVQARIAAASFERGRGLENMRRNLASLSAAQFAQALDAALNPANNTQEYPAAFAAFRRAQVDTSDPNPRYLSQFEQEGYQGREAVFMARLLRHMLEGLSEPERSACEESVVGAVPKAERRRRWVNFIAKHPPATLLASMACKARKHQSV